MRMGEGMISLLSYKFFFLCLYLILQLLRGSQQRLCASRAIVLPGESSQGRPLTPIRLANADESMMIFTNQDREYARVACARPEGKRSSQLPSFVTLSGAKGLSGWADRSFAPLRMTILHRLRVARTTSYLKCIGGNPPTLHELSRPIRIG